VTETNTEKGGKMSEPTNFRRSLFLGLVAGLALSLGGCLEFSHSLVDVPAPNDPRLLGYWYTDNESDPAEFLFEEADSHMLRLKVLDVKKCRLEFYQLTRTEIDKRNFVIVVEIKNGQVIDDPTMRLPVSYEMADENQMTIYASDIHLFEKAVENGELSGTAPKKGYLQKVYVTASPDELRSFIIAHPEAVKTKLLTARRGRLSPSHACKLEGF
jgi:hypothetical protein